MAFLCQLLTAQENTEKSLNVGEALPQELMNYPLRVVNHPEGKKTITLNDFKNKKLIILDFWATWCKACVLQFYNVDKLKKQFGNDVEFIPVNSIEKTKDNIGKIKESLASVKKNMGITPEFSVVMDSALAATFKHAILPHIVWLTGAGTVLTSTHSPELTDKNISLYLKSSQISGNVKADIIGYKKEIPISLQVKPSQLKDEYTQSFFSNYIEGINSEPGNIHQVGDLFIYRFANYPLRTMFINAYKEIFLVRNLKLCQFDFSPSVSPELRGKIMRPIKYKDEFVFEYTTKGVLNDSIGCNKLREALKDHFGLRVRQIKKAAPVWEVEVGSKSKLNQLVSKSKVTDFNLYSGGKPLFMKKAGLSVLLDYFSQSLNMYIVDKTGLEANLDLTLPNDLDCTDKTSVMRYLEKIGLKVSEHKRDLDFALFEPVSN